MEFSRHTGKYCQHTGVGCHFLLQTPTVTSMISCCSKERFKKKKKCVELLFGSVVKNLPANAGDAVSIPGLGDPTCSRAAKPVRHNY